MTMQSLPEMARCLRTSRVLQAYLDGETDERTARRVAHHLEDCRRCGLQASTDHPPQPLGPGVAAASPWLARTDRGHSIPWLHSSSCST